MNKTLVNLVMLAVTMPVFWGVLIFVFSKVSTVHFWSAIPVMLLAFAISSLLCVRLTTSLTTVVPVVVESALMAGVATLTCYFSFLYFTPYVTGSMLMTSELMIMVNQFTHESEIFSRGLVFKSIICTAGIIFFVSYLVLAKIFSGTPTVESWIWYPPKIPRPRCRDTFVLLGLIIAFRVLNLHFVTKVEVRG